MTDHIAGHLLVGETEAGDISVTHPNIVADADGVGHMLFSPTQARNLARVLCEAADRADKIRLADVVSNSFQRNPKILTCI